MPPPAQVLLDRELQLIHSCQVRALKIGSHAIDDHQERPQLRASNPRRSHEFP